VPYTTGTADMKLNAIIIASDDPSTFTPTSTNRLKWGNELATIQLVKALVDNVESSDANVQTLNQMLNWQHAPKLNGIAIYSYLHSKGINCEIIDCFSFEKPRFRELLQYRPKVIILSTTFIPLKAALKHLVARIRKTAGPIPIIAGGPFIFASYLLHQRKDDPDYDTDSPVQDYLFLDDLPVPGIDYFIISSQGLQTLHKLVKGIIRSEAVDSIPNIAYYRHEELVINPVVAEPFEKVAIDWPNLPQRIFSNGVLNIQASNGCPYNCRYCNFVKDPQATFVRPIDEIVDDMIHIQKKGIKYVRFVDDNFRLGKPDLKQVCKNFIEAGVTLKWMSFMRIDALMGFDMDLLKRSGCVEVQLGMESAHAGMLQKMNKNVNADHYYPVIRNLMRHGINVSATFIIGFPGETPETARTTIDFIKSINFEKAPGHFRWSLFCFGIAPLSPIYPESQRTESNLQGYFIKWRHDGMDSATARSIIDKAYNEIDSSSPPYTGDNLEILDGLPPEKRKEFLLTRHRLSKLAAEKTLKQEDFVSAFSACLQG
jgi:p-methyltransferase